MAVYQLLAGSHIEGSVEYFMPSGLAQTVPDPGGFRLQGSDRVWPCTPPLTGWGQTPVVLVTSPNNLAAACPGKFLYVSG